MKKQEQDVAINFLAILLTYFLRGWLLMLTFGILHHYFPVVPDFGYFESFIFGAVLIFTRSKGT